MARCCASPFRLARRETGRCSREMQVDRRENFLTTGEDVEPQDGGTAARVVPVTEAGPASTLDSLDPAASVAVVCLRPMPLTPSLLRLPHPSMFLFQGFSRTMEALSVGFPCTGQPGMAEELCPGAAINHHGSMPRPVSSEGTIPWGPRGTEAPWLTAQ